MKSFKQYITEQLDRDQFVSRPEYPIPKKFNKHDQFRHRIGISAAAAAAGGIGGVMGLGIDDGVWNPYEDDIEDYVPVEDPPEEPQPPCGENSPCGYENCFEPDCTIPIDVLIDWWDAWFEYWDAMEAWELAFDIWCDAFPVACGELMEPIDPAWDVFWNVMLPIKLNKLFQEP